MFQEGKKKKEEEGPEMTKHCMLEKFKETQYDPK